MVHSQPPHRFDRRSFLQHGLHGAGALVGASALLHSAGCSSQESGGNATGPQSAESGPEQQATGPHVVLITLDTTRSDHLGCYGYESETSPNLDRFAEYAEVYDRAIATGTWTFPTHASLFTGRFAASHGARVDSEGALALSSAISGPDLFQQLRARPMGRDETTLAQILGESGYATAGFVGGPWMKRVFGLDKGFQTYDDELVDTLNGGRAKDVTDRAIRWLRTPVSGPRFLFLNYFDPHEPLAPPAEFADHFFEGRSVPPKAAARSAADRVKLYDAEIRYMDHHLGRLFNELKNRDLFDDSWIIVTADHGELQGEHGLHGHGHVPYREVVRIPLIIKQPGATGLDRPRNETWIQLVDILPLVLNGLGLPVPGEVHGGKTSDSPVIVESRTLPTLQEFANLEAGNWFSIIEGGLKLIWHSEGQHSLFDLNADPAENDDLFSRRPDDARRLTEELQSFLASLPAPSPPASPAQVDDKTLKTLKSVGYLK